MTAVKCVCEFLLKQKMGLNTFADPCPLTKPAMCPRRLCDHAINVLQQSLIVPKCNQLEYPGEKHKNSIHRTNIPFIVFSCHYSTCMSTAGQEKAKKTVTINCSLSLIFNF